MIGIVCAFFHTEGKGFYSKKQRKIMEYRQKQKNPLWGKKPKRIFLKLVKLYLIFIKQWYNI